MKNGDISNKISSPNIGFRLNDFLIVDRQRSLFRKIKDLFTGIGESSINQPVMRCLNQVYYRTSMTVDLVVIGGNEERYSELLQEIPYNILHKVEDVYGIEALIDSGILTYFVTTDAEQNIIRGMGCLTLDMFNDFMSKGLRRI